MTKENKNSLYAEAWQRLLKNKMSVVGLVMVAFYLLIAALAPILPIHSNSRQVLNHQNLAPSLFKSAGTLLVEKEKKKLIAEGAVEGSSSLEKILLDLQKELEQETKVFGDETVYINQNHYLLGTDDLGRDLLARIIFGGQISIAIGLLGAFISVFLGTIIGSLSGYLGGKVDYTLMRIVDLLYGLPYMMLVIILMAILGRSIVNLFLALSMISWLTTARVVRGQILSLKNSLFVESARSLGASSLRIIFVHLIPNCFGIIVVFTTLRIPVFIMMESFLAYLGLGVSAPLASWGSLIADGVSSMELFPWRVISPALIMTLFLFAMNFLGDGLRDALDPKKTTLE